ncbi:MAG: adenine phosphoribosyltransferase [Sedimentisphaerales bacterium]|jgi:adenine phosphoribosyltransferase|nr:adenine phosphoribosyltransferase [Sedimentisphaerales bacterium]
MQLVADKQQIDLASYIRAIQDWPRPGILFRDITPLLADSKAFRAAVDALIRDYLGQSIDYVAAIEARGFIFGSAAADRLKVGFVPIRKTGKLPYKTQRITYQLEYGTDSLEVHVDAFNKGARILLIDDLLATGGTMAAACRLVEGLGGKVVGISFLVELTELKGRDRLARYKVTSAIQY